MGRGLEDQYTCDASALSGQHDQGGQWYCSYNRLTQQDITLGTAQAQQPHVRQASSGSKHTDAQTCSPWLHTHLPARCRSRSLSTREHNLRTVQGVKFARAPIPALLSRQQEEPAPALHSLNSQHSPLPLNLHDQAPACAGLCLAGQSRTEQPWHNGGIAGLRSDFGACLHSSGCTCGAPTQHHCGRAAWDTVALERTLPQAARDAARSRRAPLHQSAQTSTHT